MTPAEHYAAAELELSQVHEESDGTWALARAQAATAHAMLAQAPLSAPARSEVLEEVAAAIEARAGREGNLAIAALIREGADVARSLTA